MGLTSTCITIYKAPPDLGAASLRSHGIAWRSPIHGVSKPLDLLHRCATMEAQVEEWAKALKDEHRQANVKDEE